MPCCHRGAAGRRHRPPAGRPTAAHPVPAPIWVTTSITSRGRASHPRWALLSSEAIRAHRLPLLPGLVQSSIAAELAVSTWPVREALRELAAEGFVRFDGRGGAVVRELCRTEREDIYEIRMMLEPVATARAAMSATGPACGLRSSCWRPWRPRPAARAGPNTTPASTTSSPPGWQQPMAGRDVDEPPGAVHRYITHSVLAVPDARSAPTPSTRRSCAPSSHTIPGRRPMRCSVISTARSAPCGRSASSVRPLTLLAGPTTGVSLITCQPGSSSLRVTG